MAQCCSNTSIYLGQFLLSPLVTIGWSSPRRHQLFLQMAATCTSRFFQERPSMASQLTPVMAADRQRRRSLHEVCGKNTGIIMNHYCIPICILGETEKRTTMWEPFRPCRNLRSTSPGFVSQASCFMCFFLQDLRFRMPQVTMWGVFRGDLRKSWHWGDWNGFHMPCAKLVHRNI